MADNIYKDFKKTGPWHILRLKNKRYLQLKMKSNNDNIDYYFYLEYEDPITFDDFF